MLFYLHVILPTARRRKVDVRSRSRSRSRLRHLSRILNRMPEPFPIPTVLCDFCCQVYFTHFLCTYSYHNIFMFEYYCPMTYVRDQRKKKLHNLCRGRARQRWPRRRPPLVRLYEWAVHSQLCNSKKMYILIHYLTSHIQFKSLTVFFNVKICSLPCTVQ